MEKMTKKEMYTLIAELCADNADVVEFCNAEIVRLDSKAAKAKEKAAEKKAQGDELYAVIVEAVGDEFVTAEAVLESIEGEDLTVAKVRARLSQAVKNGALVKESIKADGKAKMHYKKA